MLSENIDRTKKEYLDKNGKYGRYQELFKKHNEEKAEKERRENLIDICSENE